MVKANELRIGNWIADHEAGGYFQIEEIYKVVDDYWVSYRNGSIRCIIEELEPIPLTEEWLIKFGFEKQENYWRRLYICNDWTYIYWKKLIGVEISVNKHSLMLPHIKYVHELQNLYFALRGQELEKKGGNNE